MSVSLVAPKTGALGNIDNANSQFWNFTITEAGAAAGIAVVSGNFAIKVDQGTTEQIFFRFYQGFSYNGSGGTTLLGQTAKNPGDFTTNAFTPTLFQITNTGNLPIGPYSLTLTTSGIPNDAYNMKGAASGGDPISLFNSSTGVALSSSYYANAGPSPTPYVTPTPAPSPTPVPETPQWFASLLVGLGIVFFVIYRRGSQTTRGASLN